MRLCLRCLSLVLTSAQYGQQSVFTNQPVIKMIQRGFGKTIEAINRNPTNFDTSLDALIVLKTAGVTSNEAAAMMRKGSSQPVNPVPATAMASAPTPAVEAPAAATAPAAMTAPQGQVLSKSPVFLTSASKGNTWSSGRDQSIEMSKDFERTCPGVRISLNQQVTDHTVQLNHIEHGFGRDNQILVANHDGDLIKTTDGSSIKGGVKKACEDILQDWASEKR